MQGVLDWMKFNNSQSLLSLKRVLEAVMQQMRKAPAEELLAAFQVSARTPPHHPPLHARAETQACQSLAVCFWRLGCKWPASERAGGSSRWRSRCGSCCMLESKAWASARPLPSACRSMAA